MKRLKVSLIDRATILHESEMLFIQVTLALAAILRGLSYSISSVQGHTTAIEYLLPSWLLASTFIIFGFGIFVGTLTRRYRLSLISHTMLSAFYLGLGLSYIITNGAIGARVAIGFLAVFSFVHFIYANASARMWRFKEVAVAYLKEEEK